MVEVEARDETRVERVQLLRNGRLLNADHLLSRQLLTRSDTMLRVRYRIAILPGRNSIEAVAINSSRVRSAAERASITVETDRQENQSLYVLEVGADK